MLATEVGDLDVYIRTDQEPSDLSVFHRNSYQADDWIRGHVAIPDQQDVYRVSTEALVINMCFRDGSITADT